MGLVSSGALSDMVGGEGEDAAEGEDAGCGELEGGGGRAQSGAGGGGEGGLIQRVRTGRIGALSRRGWAQQVREGRGKERFGR